MLTPVPPDLSSKFSTIWDDAQLVPATKWDEWKERHLPRWWLKNHPVRKIPFAYEFPEYVIKKVSRGWVCTRDGWICEKCKEIKGREGPEVNGE